MMDERNLESNDCIEIIRSFTDYKSYRIIKLPNEMKVILISDIKPEDSVLFSDINKNKSPPKSACALRIDVGGFNDPPELQGLAHYLEHMVSMGSEKYPMENDFDASVSQHGGYSNASSGEENTVFYFDSHLDHFESILDKFANFFINPLLSKESMDRELDAINSEYKLVCSNSEKREIYFLYQLSKENSPFRKFTNGNKKSLREDPLLKNINVYECIQDFRKTMYSSHKMTLAIQSRNSLDNLEKIVKSIFSDIPKFQTQEIDKYQVIESFDTPEFNKLYFVTSLDDVKVLKLTWSLPSDINDYKNATLSTICYLINYEGPGSLFEYLSKLKYITSVDSYQILTSFPVMIQISLHMTDLGLDSFQDIISIIFSFINILKQGIPERNFKEYMQICYNNFIYKENVKPIKLVEDLAKTFEFHISKPVWSTPYEPNICKEILNYVTVDRMNVMIISKLYESTAYKISDYYDVKYLARNFSQEELTEWLHPYVINELHLSDQSKFVATNFELLPFEDNYDNPVNLITTESKELETFGDLWYLSDGRFQLPKAIIRFNLLFHPRFEGLLNDFLTQLIINHLVKNKLHKIQLNALMPGLDVSIDSSSSGLHIYIEGFNDKIPILLTSIIDGIKTPSLNESDFFIYKKDLLKIYQTHPSPEGLEQLKSISLSQLLGFYSSFLKSMRIQSSFYGNISTEQAISCFRYCIDQFGLESTESLTKNIKKSIPVNDDRNPIYSSSSDELNTTVTVRYRIGLGTHKDQAYNRFLCYLLQEPCFTFLRTREVLGYSIKLQYTENDESFGLSICVKSESNKFTIIHLVKKIREFFEEIAVDFIEKLPIDEFENYKSSFISNMFLNDLGMSDIECRNWTEITNETYMFDRLNKHEYFIKNITKLDLLEYFTQKYLSKCQQRRHNIKINAIKTEITVADNLYSTKVKINPLKRTRIT